MIYNDRQWPGGFVASISTFGLAGFSGAKLGTLKSRIWGNCGDAEGNDGFIEKHFQPWLLSISARGWLAQGE
jgi:hypothetical protein